MNKRLSAGKLPIPILEKLLKKYAPKGKGVVVGPGIGIDAAVIKPGPGLIIAKTDPITFVAEDIGLYAIDVNSNDIAAMGGVPRWFLAAILLPVGYSEKETERIFSGLSKACASLGISLCGGHTEVTYGIGRPIVVGSMLGTVGPKGIITAAGARPGDSLILTKGIAIEAASIIAREKARELEKDFPPSFIKRCKRLIKNPGLSVLKDAQIAVRSGEVHAMHDPTEGGLATGVHELAMASRCGALLYYEKVPVLSEAKRLCEHYAIDVLGAISSGALLIAAKESDSNRIISSLKRSGVKASRIGQVTDKKYGVKMLKDKKTRDLRLFESDEITRIFAKTK